MTRKLQFVLMTLLVTAALASLAAPPRFSNFNSLRIDEGATAKTEPSGSNARVKKESASSTQEAKSGKVSDPIEAIIQVNTTQTSVKTSAVETRNMDEVEIGKPKLPVQKTESEAPQTEKEKTVTTRTGPRTVISTKASNGNGGNKSWSAFWASLFSKKKLAGIEKTHKQPDQLINTSQYHKDTNQLLQQGDLHRYYPGYKGLWKAESTQVMCSMRQLIPDYGYVEFRQGVGQPLEFALYVTHPPAGVGKAHLRVEPAPWQHYVKAKDLGIIEVDPGERAVIATASWSHRLLMELVQGMQPKMRYWDSADATDDIEVILSAINFQDSLQRFHTCLEKMLRYDFAQVQRTLVSFNPDSSRLTKTAISRMAEVLEILKHDKDIKRVELELYTHRKGLVQYNFRLATRRARAIRDYFLRKGISDNKLIIKIHTHSKEKLKRLGYNIHDVHILLVREDK